MKKIVKKLLFIVILLAVPFIIVSTNVYADIDPKHIRQVEVLTVKQ